MSHRAPRCMRRLFSLLSLGLSRAAPMLPGGATPLCVAAAIGDGDTASQTQSGFTGITQAPGARCPKLWGTPCQSHRRPPSAGRHRVAVSSPRVQQKQQPAADGLLAAQQTERGLADARPGAVLSNAPPARSTSRPHQGQAPGGADGAHDCGGIRQRAQVVGVPPRRRTAPRRPNLRRDALQQFRPT
jgi:hypothetical protein